MMTVFFFFLNLYELLLLSMKKYNLKNVCNQTADVIYRQIFTNIYQIVFTNIYQK